MSFNVTVGGDVGADDVGAGAGAGTDVGDTNHATYSVVLTDGQPSAGVLWKVRFPGALATSPLVSGCTVAAVDVVSGVVAVRPSSSQWTIAAGWTKQL